MPSFLIFKGSNQEDLVRINMDSGKVDVLKEPKDEALREAYDAFWEGIAGRGYSFSTRVKELTLTLQEIREVLVQSNMDGTVLSGLRAFSNELKTEWIQRLDEVLEDNMNLVNHLKNEW